MTIAFGRKALLLLLPLTTLMASCERGSLKKLDASAESARLESETEAVLESIDAATLRSSGGAPCAWATAFPMCASVDTSDMTYPDTTVLVFDPACTGLDGRSREGTIRIILSGPMDVVGSVRTVLFEDFGSGSYHADGSVTTTYTGTVGGNPSFARSVDMDWDVPAGDFGRVFNGNVTWLAGWNTPECLDNVWEITGSSTITTPWGDMTRSITSPLIVDRPCGYITQGTVDVDGPYGDRVLDYGSGSCDDEATITLPSGTVFTLDLDDFGWRRR